MTYWWFATSGSFFLAALAWRSRRVSSVVLFGLGVLTLLAGIATVTGALSSVPWFARSPVREAILFGTMGLGMIARMLSLAIEERRKARAKAPTKPPPSLALDTWDVLYPFLSSAITFGALLEATTGRNLDLMLLLFAFQNGFFWQTVLGAAKPR